MTYIAESAESLEISFAFVQFLGLYSDYQIEWPAGMQSIFSNMLFFNLEYALHMRARALAARLLTALTRVRTYVACPLGCACAHQHCLFSCVPTR